MVVGGWIVSVWCGVAGALAPMGSVGGECRGGGVVQTVLPGAFHSDGLCSCVVAPGCGGCMHGVIAVVWC